jgi:glycosyltransferase involved in cell wall biosynthesis
VSAPNLLQIVPSLAHGGLARATLDAAQAVIAAGGNAIVASPGGSMVPDLLRARATHLELPPGWRSLWSRFGLPHRLTASLRDSGVDIVQARSSSTAWIAGALAHRLGAKWSAVLHRPLMRRGLRGRMTANALTRADALIAVSEHVARSIAERLPAAQERLSVLTPGVNLNRFDPAAVRADRVIKLAQELRVPDGRPVVLCPTRFDQDRGQSNLIAAIRRLARDDVFCLLLGSTGGATPFEKRLEREIEKSTLLGRVQIGPYVEDMPAAYMLADVVVATGGAREGFSLSLTEAQAMGRPAVAEEGGGAGEAVQPGVTGWLAPQDDPAGLADALSQALSLTVGQRAELARTAQERVRQRYDLAAANAKMLHLYNSLAR